MPMFCRGLWGDDKIAKWTKSLSDAASNICVHKHSRVVSTYCYGETNRSFLSWLRAYPILMSPDPVSSWGLEGDRKPSYGENMMAKNRGDNNWGVSTWRHKLEIIRRAVKEHGEVVWLDWDCWMMKPLPDDFWETMRKGKTFQASLLKFTRRVLPWRRDANAVCSPHGAFIYCRDYEIADRMMELSREFPTYIDEVLFIKFIERAWGVEWNDKSPDRWVGEGWEPYCFGQRFQYRKNFDPIFQEGSIYPGS